MIRQETIMNEKQQGKNIGAYYYCFSDKLGEGAFGKVFKGHHINTKEFVAIKVMDAKFLKDQQLKDSIENEVNTMKQMTNNKNIVHLIDVMMSPNNIYMIQEFCNGGDLAHYLQKFPKNRLTESSALDILKQLLYGFSEMVMKGIVHRDLKPENILIKDGVFKIADFGFSKNVDNFSKGMLQSLLGTPLYMAPQILQNQPYTSKSDIWSLGLIYYEMIYGRTPWEVKSQLQLIQKIKNEQIPFPPDVIISDLSKNFILGCLQANEAERLSFDDIFLHPLFGNCFRYQERLQEMGQKSDKIMEKLLGIIFSKGIQIEELFKTIDASGNAMLEFDEFCKMLKYIDPNITRHQCDVLFNKFDLNGDNEITFEEFQTTLSATIQNFKNNPTLSPIVVNQPQTRPNQQNQSLDNALRCIQKLNQIVQHPQFSLEKVFWMFDTTHDLNLDYNEFSKMLKILNSEIKQEEIQLIFKMFDANGDGTITFNEFTDGLKMDQLERNPIYQNYQKQNQSTGQFVQQNQQMQQQQSLIKNMGQQQQQQQQQNYPNQNYQNQNYPNQNQNYPNQNQNYPNQNQNYPNQPQTNQNYPSLSQYNQPTNSMPGMPGMQQSGTYGFQNNQMQQEHQPNQANWNQQYPPNPTPPQPQPNFMESTNLNPHDQPAYGLHTQQTFGQQQQPYGQQHPFDQQAPINQNFGMTSQKVQPNSPPTQFGGYGQPAFAPNQPPAQFGIHGQPAFPPNSPPPQYGAGGNQQFRGPTSPSPQYGAGGNQQFGGQLPNQGGYPPINPQNQQSQPFGQQQFPNQGPAGFQQSQPYGQQQQNSNYFNQQPFPNQQQFYQQSQTLMKQFKQNLKNNQQQLQNMLTYSDFDKDGLLNFQEFTNFLGQIRMQLSPNDINTIFVTIDHQRKQKLAMQDIIGVLLNPSF